MSAIIDLLLEYLPKVAKTIQTLTQYAPEAVDIIQDWTAFFNRSMETLNREVELTPEQEVLRDQIIEAHKHEAWWQPVTPRPGVRQDGSKS